MAVAHRLVTAVITLTLAVAPASADAGGRHKARPSVAGCPVFPLSNMWNKRVDRMPVARGSDRIIRSLGGANLHPDFGSGRWRGGLIGFPFTTVGADQPLVPISFGDHRHSDPGPYPLPADAPIEATVGRNSDRHVIVVDRHRCELYELYQGELRAGGARWHATAGATWNLRSNALRPDGWTSADAAGLPIFPGLVRFEEVRKGAIRHALRIAVPRTRRAWRHPARHASSNTHDPSLPAMGERLRLKSSVDPHRFPRQARVVVRALKRYGVLVADNGAPLHLSGAPHDGWDMSQVYSLTGLRASDFEVVDTGAPLTRAPSG
jgi:hypothetical protein